MTQAFSEGRRQMLAGLLRESVVLCCAQSCSAVDKQRTSRERGCQKSTSYNRENYNCDSTFSFEPGGRRFESVRARKFRFFLVPKCKAGFPWRRAELAYVRFARCSFSDVLPPR